MCAAYANTINDPSTLKAENKALRIRHIHQVRRKRLPVMLTIRKACMKSCRNRSTKHESREMRKKLFYSIFPASLKLRKTVRCVCRLHEWIFTCGVNNGNFSSEKKTLRCTPRQASRDNTPGVGLHCVSVSLIAVFFLSILFYVVRVFFLQFTRNTASLNKMLSP